MPDGSGVSVSTGDALGEGGGVGLGLIDGDGVGLTIDALGVGLGDGLGTVGGTGPWSPSTRAAPTTATELTDPTATASASNIANA